MKDFVFLTTLITLHSVYATTDYSGQTIKSDWSEQDVSGYNFSGTTFNAYYYGDTISFWKATGNGTDFSNVNYQPKLTYHSEANGIAVFREGTFKKANFTNAIVSGAEFQSANLEGSIFKDAWASGAWFEYAYLRGASFNGTHFLVQNLATQT